jgi:hypothetical protein
VVPTLAASQLERRSLFEHGAFELTQFATRLHAELVHQPLTGALEHSQRVGLTSRAVERRHELRLQMLPERVIGNGHLQLGDQLAIMA